MFDNLADSSAIADVEQKEHLKSIKMVNMNLALDVAVVGGLVLTRIILNMQYIMVPLFIYVTLRIMFNKPMYSFAYLLMLIPNIGILSMPLIPIPMFSILIPVAILKLIVSKQIKKVNTMIFSMTFILLIYEFLHGFMYSVHAIMTLISWGLVITYVFLLSSSKKSIYNHDLSIKYYMGGLYISSVYGLYNNFLRTGSFFIFSRNNVTDRFMGSSGDPNYYSLYIMIGLFSLLGILNNKRNRLSKFLYSLSFIVFPVLAIMSLSRMFIIVFVVAGSIYILRVVFSLKKFKRHKNAIIKISPIFLIIYFIFPNILMENLNLILSRFSMYSGDLTALTSNRNIIAIAIIDFLRSNPLALLFGVGIQSYGDRIGNGIGYAHNLILELIAACGIIGTIIFIAYVIFLVLETIKDSNNSSLKKVGIIRWLPLIAMFASYMSINAIEVESFYILLIFAIKNLVHNDECSDV